MENKGRSQIKNHFRNKNLLLVQKRFKYVNRLLINLFPSLLKKSARWLIFPKEIASLSKYVKCCMSFRPLTNQHHHYIVGIYFVWLRKKDLQQIVFAD